MSEENKSKIQINKSEFSINKSEFFQTPKYGS